MQTRTKIRIDSWAGRTLVFFLNLAARLLGKILRPDHSLTKAPGKIVVCKFLGMGSIIQSTPLLQTLRANFPNAKIFFVTSPANTTLMKSVSAVDETLYIDDSSFGHVFSSSLRLLRRLWKEKIDLYIDLETYSYFSTAIATMSCARNRMGFYRVERNIRLGVYTHMMFFNARAPIAQSYLQMARLAGCREIIDQLYSFPVSNEAFESFKRKLSEIKVAPTAPYILINPNASDLRIERRWPASNFIALAEALQQKFQQYQIFLIGSASEHAYVESVYAGINTERRNRIFNTAGLFNLEELFALVRGSSLMITNDTGPMHISFSFRRPTVALFGPASPDQYGQNDYAFGFYKNIYCSPCVHDFLTPPCRGDNQCMKKIAPQEVLDLCIQILDKQLKQQHSVNETGIDFLKNDHHSVLGVVERN